MWTKHKLVVVFLPKTTNFLLPPFSFIYCSHLTCSYSLLFLMCLLLVPFILHLCLAPCRIGLYCIFSLIHAPFSCVLSHTPLTFSLPHAPSPFRLFLSFSLPSFSIFLLFLFLLPFFFFRILSFPFSFLPFFFLALLLCHFVGTYSSLLSFSTFFHPCPSEPSLASFFLPSSLSFLSQSPGLRLLAVVPLAEDNETEDVAGGPEAARHHRAHP